MTETAAMADIVLPATMFLEHDDIYRGGGHQYILLGPKLIEPPGECRTNHQVIRRARRAPRRRPPRLRHERARAHRLDAPELQPRHAGRTRGEALDRLPARLPDARTISTASPIRTASSASSRTGRGSRRRTTAPMGPWRDAARVPRLLAGDRGGGCGAIRSGSPPRRRARSSTRPSTRRRRRGRRKAAGRRC